MFLQLLVFSFSLTPAGRRSIHSQIRPFLPGMADFQCLAVHSEDGKHTSLYDKVILRTFENQEFFEQPMPFFLPPPIFSRLDTPVDYNYRPDIHPKLVWL